MHWGIPCVLMDKWSPEGMLQLIDKYKCTTSHMVPTQFHRLLGLPEEVRGRYDCSSTRTMIHAAAPCPPDVKRRMLDWWGDSIWEYYAATEGGGTIVSPEEWRKYPGTVGKAWANAEVRIFDDDGKAVATGEQGTVYMLLGETTSFEYKGSITLTNRLGMIPIPSNNCFAVPTTKHTNQKTTVTTTETMAFFQTTPEKAETQ